MQSRPLRTWITNLYYFHDITQTVPLWIFVKQTCLGSIWNSFEDNMDVLEILKYQSILIQHMIQIYFLFLSVQLSTG